MTAIHAHRIEPLLGEWQLHETFDLMHPASILLREESQSVTTSLRVGTNRFLMSDPRYGAHRRSTATLPNDRSRSLVNHFPDVLWLTIKSATILVVETKFGCDSDLVAERRERSTSSSFVYEP